MAKRKKKKNSGRGNLFKASAGIFFLVLIVVSAGILAHLFIPVTDSSRSGKPDIKKAAFKKQKKNLPEYEIYTDEVNKYDKAEPVISQKTGKPLDSLPVVAIIIDDLGFDKNIASDFLTLDIPLTFSILPYSPYKKKISAAARKKGIEIMLHLPMEPVEYPLVQIEEGALLTSMSPDVMINQLNKSLDSVPYIKGVNNHMGSKMTSISSQMRQIFTILKKRDLFFIDSRTTIKTICKPSARLLQLPYAQRDVFLDHSQEYQDIKKQIKRLLYIASQKGIAVGIGHPYPVTYEVLREELPSIKKSVKLVFASEVAQIPN
ncbi:MAG: divergent polysaccharide deacetylase family protein [Desulfobacterales bacterium]|nr:divergent polysaccharide deacetylase family protein [Desulfobacterales bacterium]